jgi:hypothetical protein
MRSPRGVVLRSCALVTVSLWHCRRVQRYVPLKCCSSLISRSARLARIFLLKTLVTFLMATPSPVWLLVAALEAHYQRRVCALPRAVESYQTMPYAPWPNSLVTL